MPPVPQYILDTNPESFTLDAFIEANEGLPDEDLAAILDLAPGQSTEIDLGAGGVFTITRLTGKRR